MNTEKSAPYNHKDVENNISNFWLEKDIFGYKEISGEETFSIVMPPPNITGVLHLGHALDLTLPDIIVRYSRLKGINVLWIPGIDQAGIATQNVVEKELLEKGLSRESIGRESFVEEVWKWKEKYGNRIIEQIKLLGASADWNKLRFTKDELYEKAVKTAFINYYNKGLIYKGKRIINWCPRCETALSDIEVDHIDRSGELYYINYQIENSDEFLTVATTRPETMLGDTAVAVNPDDQRYNKLIGQFVILPIIDRKIQIIGDKAVDMEFGTGVVKVTPAHDPVDFEIGKRHNLEEISILDRGRILNENASKYCGLNIIEARKKILSDLTDLGYINKIEPYQHSISICERCGSTIEPIISDQWFLKTRGLCNNAIDRVNKNELKFVPDRWKKVYLNWMENIQDWCISRQIWWGIQIPVWNCECGEIIVSINNPDKCSKCNSSSLIQSTDVLDTWFGSALWPFACMGWPDSSELTEKFYPTSLLVTGFDIIFFWVARMIFSGIEYMDKVPFNVVLLHGLIRDKEGRKMSKSLNNVIDPTEIINEYGSDSLRFALINLSSISGQDISFDINKVISARNFINKIWNASRYVTQNSEHKSFEKRDINTIELSNWDKWIINKLNIAITNLNENIAEYRFNEALMKLYSFFWDDYCDWYIEISKFNKNEYVLNYILRTSIILLHPFIPFVTEKLWQTFENNDNISIINENLPEVLQLRNDVKDAVFETELTMEIIKSIRNLKSEFNLTTSKELVIYIKTDDKIKLDIISKNKKIIERLSRIFEVIIADKSLDNSIQTTVGNIFIFMPLKGFIDINKETELKKNKLDKIVKELSRIEQRLNNAEFINNAPENVIVEAKEKVDELLESKKNIETRIIELNKISDGD